MTESAVIFDVQSDIASLTFNLASRMNPLTPELLAGALDALAQVSSDPRVRVLVVAAKGKGFCVGADLAYFQSKQSVGTPLGDSVAELMDTGGAPFVTGLRALPVPVLCAVQGAVVGGGVGIALAADIVIAARSAYFMLPFVPALGLVPDMGSAWFMTRAMGRARASALALLGTRLTAEQAAQQGLIWACVDDDQLTEEVAGIATRLAALPAHGILETRALFDSIESRTLADQLRYERDRQRELIERETFVEGVAAFVGKRHPVFDGRTSTRVAK
jgi:2-(1,2-epoxy-1,2-dihydrophenyl)acetyl-CoA isomerase